MTSGVPSTLCVRDSRVAVPPLPPRHISRPRLLAELDSAGNRPLTLLAAGPGAGKTVLLTDWVRRGGARVAWLTPTRADAEPRRFWRLVEAALGAALGAADGVGGAGLGMSVPPGTSIPPGPAPGGDSADLIQELFSRVPESPPQVVVVIDDAHV
ncbi:MAG: hypothetical protein ACRDN0_40785, partial [Trebonia sp.]